MSTLGNSRQPFKIIKINPSKRISCYTQGHRFAARVLFIGWLLGSDGLEGTLAALELQGITSHHEQSSETFPSPNSLRLGGILWLLPGSPDFLGSLWGSSVALSYLVDRPSITEQLSTIFQEVEALLIKINLAPQKLELATSETLYAPRNQGSQGPELVIN